MSFSTALSGLNAATADLNVKSNNIANVNTTGFKESRAEFGDVFAVSAFGTSSKTAIGSGTVLNNVAQQFTQGNLEFTDNGLDLAISGEGFFAMAPSQDSGEIIYTRAGAFGVNKEGYIVNSQGNYLRAFPVESNGDIATTSIDSATALQLPKAQGAAKATTAVGLPLNLPSNGTALNDGAGGVLAINPFDPNTYEDSTPVTVYDSLGNEHVITTYYQKIDATVATPANTDNQWQMDVYISADEIKQPSTPVPVGASPNQLVKLGGASKIINFNSDGSLVTPAQTSLALSGTIELKSGAADQTIALNLSDSTQNSGSFTVGSLQVDGYATGRLTGVKVSDDGVIRATYSNGEAVAIGKLALARFENAQALNKIGNSAWSETTDSGRPISGEAGTGNFGQIQSGALENSNVDLTKELVGLITAQRNFQANSKAIETNNAITQTIINIR